MTKEHRMRGSIFYGIPSPKLVRLKNPVSRALEAALSYMLMSPLGLQRREPLQDLIPVIRYSCETVEAVEIVEIVETSDIA